MRKAFLVTMLVFLVGMASARQISEREARGIAASKVSALRGGARVESRGVATDNGAAAPVYVFSAPEGGFAIVAGDDRMPDMVLAYSDSAPFDYENAPAAMRAWLEEMSAFIKAGDFSKVRRSTLDYSKPLAPMITTKWNQMAPYNRLTPLDSDGTHCPTGCVATAAAQVVNYWKYPVDGGMGSHSYEWNGETLSVDFSESRYDWANMLDVYDENATEEQNNAVAKLMFDCGVACDMQYEHGGSGAFSADLTRGLIDYFGYNPGMSICYRNYCTTEEWYAIVKEELDAGRPLVYCATTPTGEGHAFVCDGYDSEGLYHINWGWGGLSDGYFCLDTLDPDAQGTGGAESGSGFSRNHNILRGMRPAQPGDIPDKGWLLCVSGVDVVVDEQDADMFGFWGDIYNKGSRVFEGEVGVSFWPESKPEEVKYVKITDFKEGTTLTFDVKKPLRLSGLNAEDLEDGIYQMRFKATALGSDQQYDIVNPADELPICFEIRNGKAVDTRPHLKINNARLDDMNFYLVIDEGAFGMFSKLIFDVTNTSETAFLNTLSLQVRYAGFFSDVSIDRYDLKRHEIAPGETYTVTLPVTHNVSGTVAMEVGIVASHEETMQNVVFDGNSFKFDIDKNYHELEFASLPTVSETSGKVTINANVAVCSGDVISSAKSKTPDYEKMVEKEVTCTIYKAGTEEAAANAVADCSGKWGESKMLLFAPETVLENGDYLAVFSYKSEPDGYDEQYDLTIGQENGYKGLNFTVKGSAGVEEVVTDGSDIPAEYFNLQGVRIDNPKPGSLVIERRGDEVVKKIVR